MSEQQLEQADPVADTLIVRVVPDQVRVDVATTAAQFEHVLVPA